MEEKVSTISARLQWILRERGLKQTDVCRLAKPYCEQNKVKLNKSALSQIVNGRTPNPSQAKLLILAKVLDVSEEWLSGYDVPMERTKPQLDLAILKNEPIEINVAPILTVILKRRGLPDVEAKRRAESIARIGDLSSEGMDLIDAALNLAEKK